jgi:hypothetical protein
MPVTILDRPNVKISLDKDEKIYKVDILGIEKYSEAGFNEFIEYFINTWKFIQTENEIYWCLIDIKNNPEQDNDLPLPAIIILIKTLLDLHSLHVKHMHSVCILTEGAQKWTDAFNFVTRIYKPEGQRPIKFTTNQDEIPGFFASNKILQN